MPKSLKIVLNLMGAILGIVGVGFLFYALDWQTSLQTLERLGIFPFIIASILYALIVILLSSAWICYLPKCAFQKEQLNDLHAIYAKSTLTKYIPSGIFQYASRQIDAVALGISQASIAMASVREMLSQIAVSLLFVGLGLLVTKDYAPLPFSNLLPMIFVTIGIILFIGLAHFHGLKKTILPFLCHVAFFSISGIISAWIALQILPDPPSFIFLISIFTLAWLAGFVVIGASGGIGVREAALLFLMAGIASNEEIAALALIIRIVNIFGDTLFALVLSPLLMRKK